MEIQQLKAWLQVLSEVQVKYPHRTIENIIENIRSVLSVKERHRK